MLGRSFLNSGNAYGAPDRSDRSDLADSFDSLCHGDQRNGASQNPDAFDLNPLGAARSLGSVEADSPFSLGFGNSGQNSNGYAGLGPSNPNLSNHGGAASLGTNSNLHTGFPGKSRDRKSAHTQHGDGFSVEYTSGFSGAASLTGTKPLARQGRVPGFFKYSETPEQLLTLCPKSGPIAGVKDPANRAGTSNDQTGTLSRDYSSESFFASMPKMGDWGDDSNIRRDPYSLW